MLISGGGEAGGSLWAVKVLLLFTVRGRESTYSHEYAFWQYVVATFPIDTMYDTVSCVFLGCTSDGEVNHRLRQEAANSEQGGLSAKERF